MKFKKRLVRKYTRVSCPIGTLAIGIDAAWIMLSKNAEIWRDMFARYLAFNVI